MKTFYHIIAVIFIGFLLGSCSDKMYVQAPCDLSELNINGSLAQELGMLNANETEVDQNTAAVDLSINYGTGENYRVQIYSANPEQENSYLLAYYILNDDSTTELMCNLLANINNLYVGVIDEEGNRVVKSVAMLNGKANVEFGTLMASAE